jgi:hypothetical protein
MRLILNSDFRKHFEGQIERDVKGVEWSTGNLGRVFHGAGLLSLPE